VLLNLTVVAGDGIGPEVTEEAIRVLEVVASGFGHELKLMRKNIGGAGLAASNDPLPADTLEACLKSGAVLLGAVGSPAYDKNPGHLRPEAGLLRLRKELGAFANLRPAKCFSALLNNSPLRPEVVRGTDIMIVRELLGGGTLKRALASAAASMVRVIFSPTTLPIDPIKNVGSITASMMGRPLMNPLPQTTASLLPVFFCSASRRSLYAFLSTNLIGSIGSMYEDALFMINLFVYLNIPTTGEQPRTPTALAPARRTREPSAAFWFGTDMLGRDIYSRVLYGARVSLTVGFSVAVLASVAGLSIGLVAGFMRWADGIVMRVMDGLMSIPPILLAVALMALTRGSVGNVITAITIAEIPRVSRLVRSVVLSLREQPFVDAAVAAGTSAPMIILRHILPNTLAPMTVQATYVCASAMIVEAILSFIGAGTPPTVPSWGNIMAEGRALWQVKPYIVFFPAAFLSVTVLAVNLLGDGLRDALDPRMAKRL